MKLSEAIRLGAMLRPQGHVLFGDNKSCAMGAALEAYGWPYIEHADMTTIKRLIEISEPIDGVTQCPACSTKESCGRSVVEHLNDFHQWTRERIADWVATSEPPAGVVVEPMKLEQEAPC